MSQADNSLTKKISEELINPSIDLGVDYAEIAFDNFADAKILEEVPVVKTIVSALKTGVAVKDYFFAKKLLTFLREFHSNKIPADRLTEFQKKLASDQKFKQKTLEYILILNDRFLEIEKSKILANLFSSHIEGKTDWIYFQELSSCLDRIFPRTISILHKLSETDFKMIRGGELDSVEIHATLSSAGLGIQQAGPPFTISKMANDLYEFGKMKNIN
jgi:hypothetical protein